MENLTRQFEKKSGLKIANLEKTVPFIVSPWWVPPKTIIALNKSEAKQNHNQMAHNLDPQHHLVVYTDGSGINDKIGAIAVKELCVKHFLVLAIALQSTRASCKG